MSRASYNQNQSGIEQSGYFSGRSSGIFADVPSRRENSSSLKITFLITMVLFCLELIISFNKTSFYNLLVYLAIFGIVLMGYFDKYYMRFIIFNLILSIIFDFVFILVLASVPTLLSSPCGTPPRPQLTPHSRPDSSASSSSSSSPS
jgi:hypothetical protein